MLFCGCFCRTLVVVALKERVKPSLCRSRFSRVAARAWIHALRATRTPRRTPTGSGEPNADAGRASENLSGGGIELASKARKHLLKA